MRIIEVQVFEEVFRIGLHEEEKSVVSSSMMNKPLCSRKSVRPSISKYVDSQTSIIEVMEHLVNSVGGLEGIAVNDLKHLQNTPILCCPEDHRCSTRDCVEQKTLCPSCKIPVCRSCMKLLHENVIVPQGLINDNYYGFLESWIWEQRVTWMEKTVSSPFWTGMTLFTVGARGRAKKGNASVKQHLLHEAMYSANQRVAYKGQIFSAPMNWLDIQKQLEEMDRDAVYVSLPVTKEVLAARVQVAIGSGLVDLNKCIREATVRRPIVVRLIEMHRERMHPDYQQQLMEDVRRRVQELAPTDEPTIPTGLIEALESDNEDALEDPVDKAAAPAVRVWNEEELCDEMDRNRPLVLAAQRDTDSQRDIEASRAHALSSVSELTVHTGSKLIKQFNTLYIPRVFQLSLPWCVGGPDFDNQPRLRRKAEEDPAVSLDMFTAMMSRRSEAQIRWDWDLNPALQSLAFASKVNLGFSMSLNRTIRKLDSPDDNTDLKLGEAASRIFDHLQFGRYEEGGRTLPLQGDVSKLGRAIGMTPMDRALLRNYEFLASRVAGTRQVRRRINHMIFSSRIVYGNPVYMTITPNPKHSVWSVRLFRCRKKDPAMTHGYPEFAQYCGFDTPSIMPTTSEDGEEFFFGHTRS